MARKDKSRICSPMSVPHPMPKTSIKDINVGEQPYSVEGNVRQVVSGAGRDARGKSTKER